MIARLRALRALLRREDPGEYEAVPTYRDDWHPGWVAQFKQVAAERERAGG